MTVAPSGLQSPVMVSSVPSYISLYSQKHIGEALINLDTPPDFVNAIAGQLQDLINRLLL
jgi:hypothetical protein